MSDMRAMSAAEVLGVRALREWILGKPEEYARVFLVEHGASVGELDAVARAEDVILLPGDSETDSGRARAVRYSGSLSEVGDELFIGERGVELQDYVAAAFVQIVGPTAVCFFDDASRRAFVDDAELARRTGVFPTALLDPRVVLADRAAIERPDEIVIPSSFRLSADGRVSVGVRGGAIGRIDELDTLLTVPLRRGAARGCSGSGAAHTPEPPAPDWIGRYLAATDLIKMLGLANGSARISGFGWSLIDDDRADAAPQTGDPFLLDTADGVVLADTITLRRQLLAPATAVVVATTQSSSAPEIAAARVAHRLGLPVADADRLCQEAIDVLGVHLGRRLASASRVGSAA